MIKKEEFLKFYQNYKSYIFLGVTAFSSLILIIFGIYPQTSKLLSNQRVEAETYKKSQLLEAKAATLQNYDQEDLDLKLRNVLNAYPVDKDLVSAVSLLQNLAQASGFSVISMSIGSGGEKQGTAESYAIKLDIAGPTSALPIILNSIETSPRLMRVSSIETTGQAASEQATISLNVNILYAAAPTGFGSVDSPLPEVSQKEEEVLATLSQTRSINLPVEIPSQLPPRGRENPFE